MYFKQKARGVWKHWNDFIKGGLVTAGTKKIRDMLVPTMDTVRYTYLMDICIKYER